MKTGVFFRQIAVKIPVVFNHSEPLGNFIKLRLNMLPLKLPLLKIARHSTNSNEQTVNTFKALASDRDAICACMNLSLNSHLFTQSLMAKLIQFSSSNTTL